jgi:RNA polymerase sigma-70 factor (sigma-E family)
VTTLCPHVRASRHLDTHGTRLVASGSPEVIASPPDGRAAQPAGGQAWIGPMQHCGPLRRLRAANRLDYRKARPVDYEEYVTARRRALFRFAVVLTGDPVLADDIVADVLGTAFERWPRVSAADNVHAYVRRMIVNEFLSWRRRHARTSSWADLSAFAGAVPNPNDDDADHRRLVEEMGALPPKQRAAVVLRYYEGLGFDEIARLLGTGENAVRSNISRALQRLRVNLTEADEAGQTGQTGQTGEIGEIASRPNTEVPR